MIAMLKINNIQVSKDMFIDLYRNGKDDWTAVYILWEEESFSSWNVALSGKEVKEIAKALSLNITE